MRRIFHCGMDGDRIPPSKGGRGIWADEDISLWNAGRHSVLWDTFRFVVINTNKAESLNKYYNTLIVNDFATFVKKPEIC
jgi:hypothetical protein